MTRYSPTAAVAEEVHRVSKEIFEFVQSLLKK